MNNNVVRLPQSNAASSSTFVYLNFWRLLTMNQTTSVACPKCTNNQLLLKYVVTYEYSYVLDANAPGECNDSELLPYLYDNREQKESHQYIQCKTCGAAFPCYFDHWDQGVSTQILQKALNAASSQSLKH